MREASEAHAWQVSGGLTHGSSSQTLLPFVREMNNTRLKNALGNPTLWINVLSLVLAVLVTASNDEWVKEHHDAVVILLAANYVITAILQWLRDINRPRAN